VFLWYHLVFSKYYTYNANDLFLRWGFILKSVFQLLLFPHYVWVYSISIQGWDWQEVVLYMDSVVTHY